MTDKEAWRMYFAVVASIRFHPASYKIKDGQDAMKSEIALAATAASEMLKQEKLKCPQE